MNAQKAVTLKAVDRTAVSQMRLIGGCVRAVAWPVAVAERGALWPCACSRLLSVVAHWRRLNTRPMDAHLNTAR